MEDQESVRTHGFERPFHPLQVASWFVFGTDFLAFCIIALPLVDTTIAKVGVASSYAISVLTVVSATVKATVCDTVDPHLRQQVDPALKCEEECMPFCTICSVPVYVRSKHCRACNKCVHVFDHHCMWLNNCIGAANYRSFAVTITSVVVMIGIVLSTCVYLLVQYIVDEDAFEDRLHSIFLFENLPKETFFGLLVVMTLANLPLFVLDMQLVVLHAFLASQHLTTYEYIMNKRTLELEVEDGEHEEEHCNKPKASNGFSRRIKTLPKCMDWIVFARCGKGRRKKNHIQRIEDPPSELGPEARPAGPEVLASEAAGSASSVAAAMPAPVLPAARRAGDSEDRPITYSPSPPGTASDTAGDVCVVMPPTVVTQGGVEHLNRTGSASNSSSSSSSSAAAWAPPAARLQGQTVTTDESATWPPSSSALETVTDTACGVSPSDRRGVVEGSCNLAAQDELLEPQKSSSDQDTTIADSSSTNGDDSALGTGPLAPKVASGGCDPQAPSASTQLKM